ncbi:hypothetical protein RYZ26_09655 [Terasakiella sp. A23]|uniref:hypothetical protein n=1 Tax=Terasakiella sp. FCG-A23 TaxID=3080561 RepID=UPI002952DFA5|nr:hypothetical protein [Terasakiella sp. A23]MDV7339858.1 hypothetical protein [Terasakiella sp. A23]
MTLERAAMVNTDYTQVALSPQEAGQDKNNPDAKGDGEFNFFGDDGFSFWDFVDMVNPLQHIPVVATAYRSLTGDEIDPGARLAGGTLYGGPIGLAASTFNVVLEHNTGKDMGDHVVAWFDGDEVPEDNPTMVADNKPWAPPTSAASGFAPIIPKSEADAFAAGEASLRMAELQDFMNPNIAQEIPVAPMPTPNTSSKGAGSAGTWSAPLEADHPFPTERPTRTPAAEVSSFTRVQPQPTPELASVQQINQPKQYTGFLAKETHNESLSALQAFARDVKTQRMQAEAQSLQQQQQPIQPAQAAPQPAAPMPTTTSQLNQTTDNAWFTQMMSQNMDRYTQQVPPKS